MIRKAKAVWRGTGRGGNLSTDSGVLAETPYSFKTHNAQEMEFAAVIEDHAGLFSDT
jgi:hypothetical protein